MNTLNRLHFAVLIDNFNSNSKQKAEELNDKSFTVDITSKVSTIAQLHSSILTELGLSQNTPRESLDVIPLNDFIMNYNEDLINNDETYLAVVSIKY